MSERLWDYRVVTLLRAVDGDTYDLTIEKRMDFGFRLVEDKRWSMRFRLLGADTPEPNEAGGSAATAAAASWIKAAIIDDVLRGQTYKHDSFGRWLIELRRSDTNESLAEWLIAGGHAEPYRHR